MAANNESGTSAASREKVLRRLLDLGLIVEVRPALTPDTMREEHELIPIEGKPISEEIIEGRR
jgi:hypothetical protein